MTAAAAERVFLPIEDEMRAVEAEFDRQASSNLQVVNYLGEFLRASGGKRLRPALLILASKAAGGGERESVIRMATVMEMLHTATLVHDDIIDNAETRRNMPSMNAQFGNQTAVLMGDWLYMSAFETSLQERSLRILDILTKLTRKMTEGELIQLTLIGKLDISEDDYFEILKRKTAYLFAACCEVGAILADAKEETVTAMRQFGLELGIAFQMSDDLLDLTSHSETLGKAAGSDLLEGKLTLPLIRLLKSDAALLPVLERIMREGNYDAMPRADLIARLGSEGVLDSVHSLALEYSARAIKSLAVLPVSEYRSCLEDVLAFATERKK
ncbi:MAG: polyprenyl synthetase family protein [Acidobacteriota bacterium]|nr:MAG: polyprenyl synthetase family protein [Acidobacteriota bacterium]